MKKILLMLLFVTTHLLQADDLGSCMKCINKDDECNCDHLRNDMIKYSVCLDNCSGEKSKKCWDDCTKEQGDILKAKFKK